MPDNQGGGLIPIRRVQNEAPRLPDIFSDEQFWQPLNEFLGQFKSFLDLLNGGKPVTWRDYPAMMVAEIGLPGLTKSDIELRVDEAARRVTITGKTRTRREGSYMEQTFQQSFIVQHPVRLDQARAKLENGMLKIGFPKLGHSAGRTINVE